jgi:hypothetical protein
VPREPGTDNSRSPELGDEIVFHDQLFASGQKIGDEGGSCVIIDVSQLLANSTEVIRLQHGTITAQFLNALPPTKQLAVTGGTGAYRNVGGDGALSPDILSSRARPRDDNYRRSDRRLLTHRGPIWPGH